MAITLGTVFLLAALVGTGHETVSTSEPATVRLLPELTMRFTPSENTGAWQGADATSSVQLLDGRMLFVFSDTFVGNTTHYVRRIDKMPHNSIAVMDTPTADPTFYIGENNDGVFRMDGEPHVHLWPVVSAVLPSGKVLIAAQRVDHRDPTLVTSGTVALLLNASAPDPSNWSYVAQKMPFTSRRLSANSGLLVRGDRVYFMGSMQDDDGRTTGQIVLRAPVEDVEAHEWANAEVFAASGWADVATASPRVAFDGQFTEGSLVTLADGRTGFVGLTGFASDVELWTCNDIARPIGWTKRPLLGVNTFLPHRTTEGFVYAYAAKVHSADALAPWVGVPADLVISFNTNLFNTTPGSFAAFDNPSVYHPIFFGVNLPRRS